MSAYFIQQRAADLPPFFLPSPFSILITPKCHKNLTGVIAPRLCFLGKPGAIFYVLSQLMEDRLSIFKGTDVAENVL